MKQAILIFSCAALVATSGCENMTREEQIIVGGLAGATAGIVTAQAFDASSEWTIIAALAGAAVGSLVARNDATDECAYSMGDGTYRILPCP